MKVGIAGAGIAGLACAALLARQGHAVDVIDRFPAPRPVGSGLMIQPVGLEVLGHLDLAEAVLERASPIRRIVGSTAWGLPVLDVSYDDFSGAAAGLGIQRAVLFDLLLAAATGAGAVLRPGLEVTGQADGMLTAGDERLGPYDLIVDALGAYSALCPKPSAPLRYGALWALLDWPEGGPFDEAALEQRYLRASRMVGVLPVGRSGPEAPRKLTFFWSLRAQDHEAWREQPLAHWKDAVRALWPETDAILPQIVSHADLTFAQYTHRTLWRPGRGAVAHVGDSFHATSPQLGQGANMALLDAAALAGAVAAVGDPAAATRLYARTRMLHVRTYQTASWLFTPLYQSDSRTLPWLRNRILAPASGWGPMPSVLARLVAGRFAGPRRLPADPAPAAPAPVPQG